MVLFYINGAFNVLRNANVPHKAFQDKNSGEKEN